MSSNLIIQTINEEDLPKAMKLLESKNLLLKSKKCGICNFDIEDIGGFIPKEGKVVPICSSTKCSIKSSFLIMKHNGNGSPVIELD